MFGEIQKYLGHNKLQFTMYPSNQNTSYTEKQENITSNGEKIHQLKMTQN